MGLTPIKKESISEQVFEQMKQQILDREWMPGTKLPSEAELGAIFGVSRVTIRQALQKLAVIGLVETRFGEGSYIKQPDLGQQMKTALLPSAYLHPHNTGEVLEFRSTIEVETAGLAARRATAKDVARLKELLEHQMDASTRTVTSFAEDDMEFHMTIARSTGNALIIATYELLSEILNSTMYQTVRGFGFDGAMPYHKRLIEAIEARDEHQAILTMKAHMENNRILFEQHADIWEQNGGEAVTQ